MKKRKIPKQVKSILAEDEIIEGSFDLKECEVYATDRRLLMMQGRTVRDFDYAHISSVAYSSKRFSWSLIVIGLIITFIGAVSGMEGGVAAAVIIVGLILLIIGVMKKSEWVEINVVGVSNPIKYKGSRDALDSLLQIVREKRLAGPTSAQKETRAIDFTEAIRKLAELRDDGIITQEEFEEKKSKLLRNSE